MKAIKGVAAAARIPVIASGGVSDLDDVRQLARLKLAGVVIGRAIYEGKLDLRAALAAAVTP
jgi:phosphoribosylformimino-5-aminoimidazole carboxamide ribotide isomerase